MEVVAWITLIWWLCSKQQLPQAFACEHVTGDVYMYILVDADMSPQNLRATDLLLLVT